MSENSSLSLNELGQRWGQLLNQALVNMLTLENENKLLLDQISALTFKYEALEKKLGELHSNTSVNRD